MNFNIGLGTYKKADYEEILRISEDRHKLDDTWEEWKKNKDKVKVGLLAQGLKTIDIIVKPKELVSYCRERGISINANSRAQFIQRKTQQLNQ